MQAIKLHQLKRSAANSCKSRPCIAGQDTYFGDCLDTFKFSRLDQYSDQSPGQKSTTEKWSLLVVQNTKLQHSSTYYLWGVASRQVHL